MFNRMPILAVTFLAGVGTAASGSLWSSELLRGVGAFLLLLSLFLLPILSQRSES